MAIGAYWVKGSDNKITCKGVIEPLTCNSYEFKGKKYPVSEKDDRNCPSFDGNKYAHAYCEGTTFHSYAFSQKKTFFSKRAQSVECFLKKNCFAQ